MSFDAWVHSVFGDKNKGFQNNFRCPYMLCPSNTDDNGQFSAGYRPARMKFVQKIQPSVYEYRCKDCGCATNVSVELLSDGRASWRINPSLVSGNPSFNLNWRR